MRRHRIITATALSLALATVGAACGDDDGADVRSFGDCDGSGSASGSASASGAATQSGSASEAATQSGSAGSGSGSASCPSGSGSGSGSGSESGAGSGSGIADDVAGSSSENPLVTDVVTEYQRWVSEQVDLTIAATKTFTDAVRAGDVEAAKAAYAPSRQGWERIEPIAGLVEEIDGAVDARVEGFEGVDDPAFTGWHRLEYLLWAQDTAEGGAADAGGEVIPLDAHIRLANPRTAETDGDLIFRSGLSYSRGFDGDGQLDQGLAFVSFQRRLSQFLNTQGRLAGEPLEEYIVPEGGGFYFALPGLAGEGGFLGARLFTRP